MQKFTQHYNKRMTTQSESIPGEQQVQNNAGGYVYQISVWEQMQRFLILGTAEGSYYCSEQKMTRENAEAVERCLAEDWRRAIDLIVAVSDSGRAPKNDPAIFALALAASGGSQDRRHYALVALPKVCRIPTHLFHFVEYCKGLRGWGRGLRKAVGRWYNEQKVDDLAYQVTKYQQRDGWGNADLLRKAHPKAISGRHDMVYRWCVDGMEGVDKKLEEINQGRTESLTRIEAIPQILDAFEKAQKEQNPKVLASLIGQYGLTREMLATEALTHKQVWEALLVKMPMTAMLRNLGNMTKLGLLEPMSQAASEVARRLRDVNRLKKARVHPLVILTALKVYQQGRGVRGSGEWRPVSQVVDALDDAFYLAFQAVEPTGKRMLLALDVSGSMDALIAGSPLSCRVAAAALALVTARTEPIYEIMAFSNRFMSLEISPRERLDDVVRKVTGLSFEETDCALPMLYAIEKGRQIDAFLVLTDNETWAGSIHPSQALRMYRQKTGIPAKLVVAGMTSTGFSIADPSDPGMLDVVGMDTAVPAMIGDFIKGGF